MLEFESRLTAAYQSWHESRGRTPDRFFSLYSNDIELHSILEASFSDAMRGPFVGKDAAIAYFASIAEQWEMLDAGLQTVVARDDRIVCIGHASWRNLKTLRVVAGPKIDVWTVRDGLAVHFLEMFDSYGCARAIGLIDWPTEH